MSVLNPEHLLAQAAKLIEPPTAGPPRQVDVRRAISSAYYAVFHAILIAAADEIVGAVHRVTANYAVVYRSIDHRQLRTICDIARAKAGAGFGTDVQTFAGAVMSLQERRNVADYDPTNQFRTVHGNQAIDLARIALHHWEAVPDVERRTFLMLLLFPPR
jgi:hypothetical protein